MCLKHLDYRDRMINLWVDYCGFLLVWIFMKISYLLIIIMGRLVSIRGSYWIVVWLGLEVNMISFVGYVGMVRRVGSEAIMRYFIIQVVGSLIIFFLGVYGIYGSGVVGDLFLGSYLIFMVLALRVGIRPFHFWFPVVMGGLGWDGVLILMTWQKVALLGLMMMIEVNFYVILFLGLASVFIGGVGGYNQMIVRGLLSYSSISHIGWIVVAIGLSESVRLLYFLIYVLIRVVVVVMLRVGGRVYISQVVFGGRVILCGVFYLIILSLGGLPPFLGFLGKWVVLLIIIEVGVAVFGGFIMIFGLVNLYYYLRIGYTSLAMWGGYGVWQVLSFSVYLKLWLIFIMIMFGIPLMIYFIL